MAVYRFAVVAPLLVASVSAWGNCIIKNSCGTPVYYWEDKGDYGPPMETIAPGQSWTKPMYQTGKDNGAGPSIKCAAAKADGSPPDEGGPITQMEYTVDAPLFRGKASFDISNVNGGPNPPFVAGGIIASSPQDSSASKTCQPGENPCSHAYTLAHDDGATTVTDMNNDILFDICGPLPGTMIPSNGNSGSGGNGGNSGGSSSSPASSPPAPPPPASSSAAPPANSPPAVEEKVANKPAAPPGGSTQVVWVTEYAAPETVVVHVNAKRTDVPEKREEHVHNHAHAHNKINKRRHGA